MANWTILKEAIAGVIKTNGNQEITGQVLQNILTNIVNTVGENATFAGVATPATNPGAPDGPVFYLAAQAGDYVNFGSIALNAGETAIIKWDNGVWSKKASGFASENSSNSIAASSLINLNLSEFCIKGKYVDESGEIGSSSNFGYIQHIYCKGARVITFSSYIRRAVFYDSDKQVLSNIEDAIEITIPSNAYFCSLNVYLSRETIITGVLYESYKRVNFNYFKASADITPEIYASDKYINTSFSEVDSVGRVIYKINVEPLGIYNISMRSLGSLAVGIVFYDANGLRLTNTGAGTAEIESTVVVAPKEASYALISAIYSQPISIKKIKRTDRLSEYLDEMSNTENAHYSDTIKRVNAVGSYKPAFVSAGPEMLTESGFIRVEDGVKGRNEDFICSPFMLIVPGSDIMATYTPGNTSGFAFYSAPSEESFISGTQQTKNIKVPDNALYFRVSSSKVSEFSIGYMSASLGALSEQLKNAVINYNIRFSDLATGFIEVATKNTKFSISHAATDFKSILLRCFEGQQFELNTIGGTGTAKAYQFFNSEGEPVGTNKAGAYMGLITAPEEAYYLCVNVNLSSMPNAENDFYLKSVLPSAKEMNNALKEISYIQKEIRGGAVEYTIDNLIPGNLNTYPVGNPANTGTLPEWAYGLFPCPPGASCTITTLGGSGTARGIGFINKDNTIIFSSGVGKLENETFIAPEGTAFVGVNLKISESSDFSLSVSTLASQVAENTKSLAELESKIDITVPEASIPLWYGKDMFFIKDAPLDFYAKGVLLKNYPAYKAVYVNHAPIVSTGKNYNFNLPVINRINPEGKIYFENGAKIDIYADDGNLYKDKWNVIKDIEVHTTDISLKQKSIKVMFIGSSTTEIGMATYVKKYLETLGVTMVGCGSKNDYLGTKSEGYYGWSNEQLCGKIQNAKTYPQTGTTASNPFMKLATSEDKVYYPDYCFTYVEGSTGTRQSYTEATDKNQDFYIFDFAWYLQTRQVETPDVVFFMLGTNGGVDNYGIYMPWIVDRIIQACPNAYVGINLGQAYRLQSDVDSKLIEMERKLTHLYNYVNRKNYDKMKVVSLHAHQSPDFSHNFEYAEGSNVFTFEAAPIDGFLHMDNNGYLQDAKCIGAFVAYCLPEV